MAVGEESISPNVLVSNVPLDGSIRESAIEDYVRTVAIDRGFSCPDRVRLLASKVTQYFRGEAVVEFPHADHARAFIRSLDSFSFRINGHQLLCRYVGSPSCSSTARPHQAKYGPPQRAIVVHGLHSTTTDASIKLAFHPAQIVSIRRAPRGACFVQFRTEEDAVKGVQTLEASGCTLDGHQVSLKYAESMPGLSSGSEAEYLSHINSSTRHAEEEFSKLEQETMTQANVGSALEGVNAGMWSQYLEHCSESQEPSTNEFRHDPATGYLKHAGSGLYYDSASMYFFSSDFSKSFIYCVDERILREVDADGRKKANGERKPMPGKLPDGIIRKNDAHIDREVELRSSDDGIDSDIADFYTWNSAPSISKPPVGSIPMAQSPRNTLTEISVPGASTKMTSGVKSSRPASKRKREEVLGLVGGPDNRKEKCAPITKAHRSTEEHVGNAGVDPICHLCKRKFATWEMLVKHEQLSDLHKQNLAQK